MKEKHLITGLIIIIVILNYVGKISLSAKGAGQHHASTIIIAESENIEFNVKFVVNYNDVAS